MTFKPPFWEEFAHGNPFKSATDQKAPPWQSAGGLASRGYHKVSSSYKYGHNMGVLILIFLRAYTLIYIYMYVYTHIQVGVQGLHKDNHPCEGCAYVDTDPLLGGRASNLHTVGLNDSHWSWTSQRDAEMTAASDS